MNIALFDIGSNTIRLNVYAVAKTGVYDLLLTRKVQAGLASYIHGGRLSDEGVKRLRDALCELKSSLKFVKIDRLAAFATAALRNISNTSSVLMRLRQSVDFEIAVLSGQAEANIGYEGVRDKLKAKDGILLDIGGGSTEITRFTADGVKRGASYPVGSLTLFEEFVTRAIWPSRKEVKALRHAVKERIPASDIAVFGASDYICAIGGSTRSVMKLANAFLSRDDRRAVFTREEIEDLYATLVKGTHDAQRLVLRICPHRVHTIVPGLAILVQLMKRFDAKVLEICPVGIREGYLKRILTEK